MSPLAIFYHLTPFSFLNAAITFDPPGAAMAA